MSAWYVISSLGFYAVDPVSGNYVFGTPLFDRVEVELGGGRKLVVEARRNSPGDQFIQSITLNRKPHNKLWFRHSDIASGGSIVFSMSGKPNEQFGSGEGAIPPSLGQ
jgi:putative alpha-1,2-mannosidase